MADKKLVFYYYSLKRRNVYTRQVQTATRTVLTFSQCTQFTLQHTTGHRYGCNHMYDRFDYFVRNIRRFYLNIIT